MKTVMAMRRRPSLGGVGHRRISLAHEAEERPELRKSERQERKWTQADPRDATNIMKKMERRIYGRQTKSRWRTIPVTDLEIKIKEIEKYNIRGVSKTDERKW